MKHKNVKGKIYVRRKLLFRAFRNVLLSFFCRGRLSALSLSRTQANLEATRPNLGATRPRVGIANLGFDAPSWQYLKY